MVRVVHFRRELGLFDGYLDMGNSSKENCISLSRNRQRLFAG